jgi:hypothetical protein
MRNTGFEMIIFVKKTAIMDSIEQNRRHRDEKDGHVDIKATVAQAEEWIARGWLSEAQALKYFNLSQATFDKFKQVKE